MGDYLWVWRNDSLVDSDIDCIHGGTRVNVWYETNLWVLMGASKTDINWWEVVVSSEGHETRAGYTIVTIYFSANNK